MPTEKLQSNRQRCEIYSRVVGYLSPVHRWNNGKKSEFHDRRTFNVWTAGAMKS
jgi:anaerobic ribonucleoside-triphosphate reductase